jgi:hypothetical protein
MNVVPWLSASKLADRLRPEHLQHIRVRDGWTLAALGVPSAALVLEILPTAGVILLLNAWVQRHALLTLPAWWLLAVILLAYVIGSVRLAPRLAKQQPLVRLLATTAAVVSVAALWIATLYGSAILSPEVFGRLSPDDAAAALVGGLRAGNIHPQAAGAPLSVASLTTYLWWRGLALGRRHLTREHLVASFRAGLTVLVAVDLVAQPLPVSERDQVNEVLALLLPADAFAGLIGMALAHLADAAQARKERQRGGNREVTEDGIGDAGQVGDTWFMMVLAVSGGLVAVALGITALIWNNGGQALSMALARLVAPTALLPSQPAKVAGGAIGSGKLPHSVGIAGGSSGSPTLSNLCFSVFLLLAVTIGALLLWARLHDQRGREHNYDEVREQLSARAVLGARWQLLTALATWHGRHGDITSANEVLPTGSVRQIYSDVLSLAVRSGRGRAADETPDEYAQRLRLEADEVHSAARTGSAPKSSVDALRVLTDAYCRARYGVDRKEPPAEAPKSVRDAQRLVTRLLSTLGHRPLHPR